MAIIAISRGTFSGGEALAKRVADRLGYQCLSRETNLEAAAKEYGVPAEDLVRRVLSAPEQRVDARPGRVIVQSRLRLGNPPKAFLLRIFVDVDRQPAEVVTAYRTSRVEKYWRKP